MRVDSAFRSHDPEERLMERERIRSRAVLTVVRASERTDVQGPTPVNGARQALPPRGDGLAGFLAALPRLFARAGDPVARDPGIGRGRARATFGGDAA